MKFLESIKEIWKANKGDYLISCIVLVFGCLLIYAVRGSPLEYSLPFSVGGAFVMMFILGLFLGGNE